jgi:hypothetical protein
MATTAEIFVQWKGTDLCADFYCECGAHFHIDAEFVYAIKCSACGATYRVPSTLTLTRIEEGAEPCTHIAKYED